MAIVQRGIWVEKGQKVSLLSFGSYFAYGLRVLWLVLGEFSEDT